MSESEREGDYVGLLVAGYVMALAFPPGGFVAGVALAGRRTGHSLAIVTISFITTVFDLFWLLV